MAFLNPTQLAKIGFAAYGDNVLVSDKASLYNPGRITLGSNIRIDDFCILSAGSGGIYLGSHIHVACYSSLIGDGRIALEDFCNLSSRVSIYSSSDDYSGEWMTSPVVPSEYTNIHRAPVTLERHVIVGSGSVILPGLTVREGACIGALSLIKSDCEAFCVYAGSPARRIGARKQRLLQLGQELTAHV